MKDTELIRAEHNRDVATLDRIVRRFRTTIEKRMDYAGFINEDGAAIVSAYAQAVQASAMLALLDKLEQGEEKGEEDV